MPAVPREAVAVIGATEAPFAPRSVRVVTSGVKQPLNTIFTIYEFPLLIGRKGCHIEIDGAELSIRHCSIFVRGSDLVVRDSDSHMGTFLDGQQIDEAVIGEGVHLIRAGSAVISIEPVDELGKTVEPIHLDAAELVDESALARTIQQRRESGPTGNGRIVLICIEGPLRTRSSKCRRPVGESGNRGIGESGESGNRGIGESGNPGIWLGTRDRACVKARPVGGACEIIRFPDFPIPRFPDSRFPICLWHVPCNVFR